LQAKGTLHFELSKSDGVVGFLEIEGEKQGAVQLGTQQEISEKDHETMI
jgi:hypothetical protein